MYKKQLSFNSITLLIMPVCPNMNDLVTLESKGIAIFDRLLL